MSPQDPSKTAFLRPVDLHVLLVLARQDRHGYGIVQDIEELSEGRIRLVPGNLYTVLRRLLDWAWIVEAGDADEATSGPPRRTYRLTSRGRTALEAEMERLRSLLASNADLAIDPSSGGSRSS